MGTCVDSIVAPVVSFSLSDSGAGADLIAAVSAALSVQDAVSAADLVNVIKTQLVQVSDSGQGADAVSMNIFLTVPDIAAAADVVGRVLASLRVADSASGVDSAIATNFSLLPSGKVTITFSMKIPRATFTLH